MLIGFSSAFVFGQAVVILKEILFMNSRGLARAL